MAEATANLKKAAEKGSTFLATTLPAIKVPPPEYRCQEKLYVNTYQLLTTCLIHVHSLSFDFLLFTLLKYIFHDVQGEPGIGCGRPTAHFDADLDRFQNFLH